MNKRVYKFTAANYAISNLQNKRLKVSTIDDLNDPFDLCAVDTTNPVLADALNSPMLKSRRTFFTSSSGYS
jgi:hypothetical protein